MSTGSWEWPITPRDQEHATRVALMRPIPYEGTAGIEHKVSSQEAEATQRGTALSLNISSGGMLLLMDNRGPEVGQVLRIRLPAAIQLAAIPTLGEVRWVRSVPFPGHQGLQFVGLRFLF